MDETEKRLAKVESLIDTHDRTLIQLQESLKEMADGIRKLAEAEIRREQDQSTFRRLFSEQSALRKDMQSLEESLNSFKGSFEHYKEAQLQATLNEAKEELSTKSKRLWDVRSALISACLMLALWVIAEKLGIHFPG